MRNAAGKMAPIDGLNAGSLQTFNLQKPQHLQSAVQRGLPVFTLLGDFTGVVFQGCVNPFSQTSGGLDPPTKANPHSAGVRSESTPSTLSLQPKLWL